MEPTEIGAVTWEAPEHHHIKKGSNWYWVLGIIAAAGAISAIVLGNTLFGVVILLGACTVILFAGREPKVIPFAVTIRGVQMGNQLFPFGTLSSYYIDEESPRAPQLLVLSSRTFMPVLVLPIPEEYIDEIEDILRRKLPEEHIEEPISEIILEFFGF